MFGRHNTFNEALTSQKTVRPRSPFDSQSNRLGQTGISLPPKIVCKPKTFEISFTSVPPARKQFHPSPNTGNEAVCLQSVFRTLFCWASGLLLGHKLDGADPNHRAPLSPVPTGNRFLQSELTTTRFRPLLFKA